MFYEEHSTQLTWSSDDYTAGFSYQFDSSDPALHPFMNESYYYSGPPLQGVPEVLTTIYKSEIWGYFFPYTPSSYVVP